MIEEKNMKRKVVKFGIVTFLTIVVSIFDNLFTYIGSPDLSREANPLVSTLRFNWTGLLVSNIIILILVIILYYYSYIKFEPVTIRCNNFREYYSMLYFNEPNRFKETFYKLPKNKIIWRYTFACLGFCFGIVVIVFRTRCVIEWLMYLYNQEMFKSYCNLIKPISYTTVFGRLDMIILVMISVLVLVFFWFCREYRKNKTALMRVNNE